MAQGRLIVPLLDFAALGTQIAVIAQGQTGRRGAVQQNEVVAVAGLAAAGAAAVLVLTAAIRVAAATAAGAVLAGGLVPEPHIGHAVFRHALAVVGVCDLIVDRVLALLGVVGGAGQGAGVRRIAIADGGTDAGLGQVCDGQRMGLAVHHAVIVRDDGLGGDVFISAVLAQGTMLHDGKPAIGGLGQNICFQRVPLQHRGFFMVGAVAEAAVGAACGSLGMIPAVRVFIGHGFRQSLRKLGGAIVQPVDIFPVAVVRFSHVAVDGAAVLADGLREMIAGIVGIHAGGAVPNGAFALAVYHCTV